MLSTLYCFCIVYMCVYVYHCMYVDDVMCRTCMRKTNHVCGPEYVVLLAQSCVWAGVSGSSGTIMCGPEYVVLLMSECTLI